MLFKAGYRLKFQPDDYYALGMKRDALKKDGFVSKEWMCINNSNIPNAANHEKYMELYKIYRELYLGIKDDFQLLADVKWYK
jgi:sugar (pentulose or hexulose) kinase